MADGTTLVANREDAMKIEELVAKAKESLGIEAVYAQPYQKDGITVITAASITGGAGGGNGHDKQGQEGEGGGFGMNARPTGAYVIKEGTVTWQPAVDVNRLLAIAGAIAVAVLLVASRMARLRTRARLSATPTT
jgi:uncharacterized spore protein YtfJ